MRDGSSDVCSSDLKTFVGACSAASLTISGAALAHDAAKPGDAQIAHIAYTAGQIDVDAGKQALAKSTNPAVRAFAEEMVRDHAAVNEKALALVKRLGVTPEANATSADLTAQAAQKHDELARLDGAAFNRAYVATERSEKHTSELQSQWRIPKASFC